MLLNVDSSSVKLIIYLNLDTLPIVFILQQPPLPHLMRLIPLCGRHFRIVPQDRRCPRG